MIFHSFYSKFVVLTRHRIRYCTGGDFLMGKDDMAINKDWHLKNKMPAQATVEQRIEWHLEHQRHCSCAPIPQKLLAEMQKRNIQLSDPEVKN